MWKSDKWVYFLFEFRTNIYTKRALLGVVFTAGSDPKAILTQESDLTVCALELYLQIFFAIILKFLESIEGISPISQFSKFESYNKFVK